MICALFWFNRFRTIRLLPGVTVCVRSGCVGQGLVQRPVSSYYNEIYNELYLKKYYAPSGTVESELNCPGAAQTVTM